MERVRYSIGRFLQKEGSIGPGQHASGDVFHIEPVLQQQARRIVGTLPRAAKDVNRLVARQFVQPVPLSCPSGMLTAPSTFSTASSNGSRTSRITPSPVSGQWLIGMSPLSTPAATIPEKFTGSFALPYWGA